MGVGRFYGLGEAARLRKRLRGATCCLAGYPAEQAEIQYRERSPIAGPLGRYPFEDIQITIVDDHPMIA